MATIEELESRLEEMRSQLAGAKAKAQTYEIEAKDHSKLVSALQAKLDAEVKRGETLEAEAKAATEKAEAVVKQTQEAAKAAQIDADLRAAAMATGARDANDVLALLDRSAVKTDSNGKVTNAAELLTEFRASKPFYFGAESSTVTGVLPTPVPPTAKPALQMNDAEYTAAKLALTRG